MPDKWSQYVVPNAAAPKPDKWAQYAQPVQQAAPSLPAGATGPLPGMPSAPKPAGLQGPPSPQSAAPRLGTFGDTVSNVGTHLKNMVAGPYHAFTDAPQDSTEQRIASAPQIIPGAAAGLGIYRMFVKPSVQAGQTAIEQGKKGNLFNADEYDAQGNYQPSAFSSAIDAIPIAGPWSRNIETEAHQKGMAPALAGLATDLAAPKIASKALGAAVKTAGKASQVASASLPASKLAATRFLVPGKPGELLQSGLKPGVKYGAGVADTLQQSIPDILAADPNASGVSGYARASDAAKDASFQPYNNIMAKYRPAPGGIGPTFPQVKETLYGGPIADAQNASIPAINAFESPSPRPTAAPPPLRASQPPQGFRGNVPPKLSPPSMPSMPRVSEPSGIVANTAEKAELYRKNIPVSVADSLREDANAKLNAFYNKAGGDQNAALSSPETARIKAIGDSTRQQLYPKLEADEGLPKGSVAAMQQKYGQLADVSDIANRREPVFARHDPVSLSQKIVAGHGNPLSMAWNYGVQKALGTLTNSDSLVNSAIDRYQHPAGTPLPPRPGLFPMMGSGIGRGLYGAGRATSALPLKFNPLLYSSAANPPK